MLLYTLRGTPFVYQGEELGLPDAEIPPESVVDIDGRDPERARCRGSLRPRQGPRPGSRPAGLVAARRGCRAPLRTATARRRRFAALAGAAAGLAAPARPCLQRGEQRSVNAGEESSATCASWMGTPCWSCSTSRRRRGPQPPRFAREGDSGAVHASQPRAGNGDPQRSPASPERGSAPAAAGWLAVAMAAGARPACAGGTTVRHRGAGRGRPRRLPAGAPPPRRDRSGCRLRPAPAERLRRGRRGCGRPPRWNDPNRHGERRRRNRRRVAATSRPSRARGTPGGAGSSAPSS